MQQHVVAPHPQSLPFQGGLLKKSFFNQKWPLRFQFLTMLQDRGTNNRNMKNWINLLFQQPPRGGELVTTTIMGYFSVNLMKECNQKLAPLIVNARKKEPSRWRCMVSRMPSDNNLDSCSTISFIDMLYSHFMGFLAAALFAHMPAVGLCSRPRGLRPTARHAAK